MTLFSRTLAEVGHLNQVHLAQAAVAAAQRAEAAAHRAAVRAANTGIRQVHNTAWEAYEATVAELQYAQDQLAAVLDPDRGGSSSDGPRKGRPGHAPGPSLRGPHAGHHNRREGRRAGSAVRQGNRARQATARRRLAHDL